MEEKKKGGKRMGAGRKPTSNPKITIPLYVERSNVLKFGSPEKLKEKIYGFIVEYRDENLESKIDYKATTKESYDAPKSSFALQDEAGQMPSVFDDQVSNFRKRLKGCKDSKQINSVLTEIKASTLAFFTKQNLTNYANEIGKDFYTD